MRWWFILLVALSACAEGVSLHPGWTTNEVNGTLQPTSAFIVVERQDQTFLPKGETGYYRRASAEVVKPDQKGNYVVTLPTETVSISLTFIAEGHIAQRRVFDRSLGVGSYEFHVELQKANNWKEMFYINLRPYLSQFITEQRYAMPEMDQLFLGDWLNQSEKVINEK